MRVVVRDIYIYICIVGITWGGVIFMGVLASLRPRMTLARLPPLNFRGTLVSISVVYEQEKGGRYSDTLRFARPAGTCIPETGREV